MSADDRHTLASASDCESKHTIVHRDAGRQERAPRRRLTAGRRWRLARSPASTAPTMVAAFQALIAKSA
jgi:hypothetical protein